MYASVRPHEHSLRYSALRGYRASRTRPLFWASLSFAGLALNNVLLFIDLIMLPPWTCSSGVQRAVAGNNSRSNLYMASGSSSPSEVV